MCCLKYEQNAYEDAAKRMPKVESFVQTPDGPGNVKSVDLLRETMKVALDSAGPNEPLKCYHNCEVCVLRNGKGSRDGISIPERPARYVEEKEEEEIFDTPILATPFYMDSKLEDAPSGRRWAGRAATASPAASIGAAGGTGAKPAGNPPRRSRPLPRAKSGPRRRKRAVRAARNPGLPRRRGPSSSLPRSPRGRRAGRPPRAVKAARPSAAGPGTGAAAAGARAAARARLRPSEQ